MMTTPTKPISEHWQRLIDEHVAEVLAACKAKSGAKHHQELARACPFVQRSALWRAWYHSVRVAKEGER